MTTTPPAAGAEIDYEAIAKAAINARFPGCWDAYPDWRQAMFVEDARRMVAALRDQGLAVFPITDVQRAAGWYGEIPDGQELPEDQSTYWTLSDLINAVLAAPELAGTEEGEG